MQQRGAAYLDLRDLVGQHLHILLVHLYTTSDHRKYFQPKDLTRHRVSANS
jgi:endonuclease/exonuclease/phosphatase family metal-dependent hydrolase